MSRAEADAGVAIVGAGPAGTATALRLGQLGVRNVVLLDRLDFPRDKTCGSAVSPKGIEVLKELGVWPDVEPRSYPITGLRLVTPGDRELFVSGGDAAAAIVCCRRTLDHVLVRRAQSFGVRFVPNFYAASLLEHDGRVAGVADREGHEIRARYTVVADGAHSRFTVSATPKRVIQAIMGWWDNVPFRPHHVEMVFDRMVVPFYGWLFPEGPARVNIGICYEDLDHTKNARDLFERFLDKQYRARLSGATQVGDWKGHPITYSYTLPRLYSPGRVVVGEAGRMTHPATAEGIYQGMLSGMFAAEALYDVMHDSVNETAAFGTYEKRCRQAFRASFWGARLWRRAIRSSLPDWIADVSLKPAVKNTVAAVMARM